MTTPTAAARRLLAGPRSYRDGTHSEQADVQTVAEAVLSVPELDDTPIDEEYLQSVGFVDNERRDGIHGWMMYHLYPDSRGLCLWVNGCICRLQTRGQLRLLAMALGVTIRE